MERGRKRGGVVESEREEPKSNDDGMYLCEAILVDATLRAQEQERAREQVRAQERAELERGWGRAKGADGVRNQTSSSGEIKTLQQSALPVQCVFSNAVGISLIWAGSASSQSSQLCDTGCAALSESVWSRVCGQAKLTIRSTSSARHATSSTSSSRSENNPDTG